jgi:hypothetical protein
MFAAIVQLRKLQAGSCSFVVVVLRKEEARNKKAGGAGKIED